MSAQGVLCEGGDVPIFDLAYVFSSYFVFDVFSSIAVLATRSKIGTAALDFVSIRLTAPSYYFP